MEAKLVFIGIVMFLYAMAQGKMSGKKLFERKPALAAWWHALFCACAAAIISFVLSITIENRNLARGQETSGKLMFVWAAAVIIAAVYGYFNAKKSPKRHKELLDADLEWAEVIYSPMFAAAFIMYFFAQQFVIPSSSMRETLIEGDRLVVNKAMFGFRLPFMKTKFLRFKQIERGDVVVFQFPSDSKKEIDCGGVQYGRDFIKRVIGKPGETVEVKNSAVYINGKPLGEEPYTQYLDPRKFPAPEVPAQEYQQLWEKRELGRLCGSQIKDNFGPVTVPPDSYFMMGDNRDNSCDSRFWGPVKEYRIKGKAWFVYWPFSRMKTIR